MIYLDYAANTPVEKEVLKTFVETTTKFIANPNSSHPLGKEAFEAIESSSNKIAEYFNIEKESIIYTSGSTESNNLVIKGIAERNKDLGKHIIISPIEHSSIIAPCNYLASLGYEISILSLTKEGSIDLEELKNTIREDTILVSICYVDSELGTIQPIKEIGKILKEYPNCSFHTDATQAIGKINVDFKNVDFVTFAPHKFYGLNGFGVLLNINNKKINPIIQGGKSTTIYRSGTPVTANIVSLEKSLSIALSNLNERYLYISNLNNYLRSELSVFSNIHINTPKNSIPNTINISFINLDAKKIIKKLEEKEIYLSTTSACSLGNTPSKSVMAITNNLELAKNSIRISISHLTKIEDLEIFINELKKIYEGELGYENN
ncbi:MAG: cysteine desulfurase [Bacilli bacterium]|nr:cysteine desulfurase [Bacilli bacterium]